MQETESVGDPLQPTFDVKTAPDQTSFPQKWKFVCIGLVVLLAFAPCLDLRLQNTSKMLKKTCMHFGEHLDFWTVGLHSKSVFNFRTMLDQANAKIKTHIKTIKYLCCNYLGTCQFVD